MFQKTGKTTEKSQKTPDVMPFSEANPLVLKVINEIMIIAHCIK